MSRRVGWLIALSALVVGALALGPGRSLLFAQKETPDKKAAEATEEDGKDDKEDKKEKKSPDVVYVPTPHDVVAKMLEVAGVKKGDVVYDLGCGDGRIVVTASKSYGVKGVGYEIDDQRIKEANENIKKNGVEKLVEIRKQDLFKADLTEASVITTYLLPWMNKKLVPSFNKMKKGSRIVAHAYDIEGIEPDKTVTITSRADGAKHTIYLWTVPLKEGEGDTEEKKEE